MIECFRRVAVLLTYTGNVLFTEPSQAMLTDRVGLLTDIMLWLCLERFEWLTGRCIDSTWVPSPYHS